MSIWDSSWRMVSMATETAISSEEAANGEVAIRKRGQGDVGKMKLEDFAELCKKQVETMEKW